MWNNWPYTNLNELNLDWILEQVKGIADKYKDLDSAIAAGVEAVQQQEQTSLQDLDNMKMTIVTAINGARDIALVDVNATKTNAINDITTAQGTAESAIAADKTNAQEAIETDKTAALAAIAALGNTWDDHYESLIAAMPADLASLTQTLAILGRILTGESEQTVTFFLGDYAGGSKTTPTPAATSDVSTNMTIGGAGFKFAFTLDDSVDADTKIYAIRWFEGKNASTGVYTGEHIVSCGNVRTYYWTVPDTCYGFSITLRNNETAFTEAPASDIATLRWYTTISDFVSVDGDQDFTEVQKAQGRENIGAASEEDYAELDSEITDLKSAFDTNIQMMNGAQKNTDSNELSMQKYGSWMPVESDVYGDQTVGETELAFIDKIYGYSYTRNQFYNKAATGCPTSDNSVNYTVDADGTIHASGTVNGTFSRLFFINPFSFQQGHKYLLYGAPSGGSSSTYYLSWSLSGSDYGSGIISTANSAVASGYVYFRANSGVQVSVSFKPILVDLTMWFGAGNEPTTVADAIARGISTDLAYDTGTLITSNVTEIQSKMSGNVIDSIKLPNGLLTYLSDKDYGKTGTFLDLKNQVYNKNGTEYDISSYATPNLLKVKENGTIHFVCENDFNAENIITFVIPFGSNGYNETIYDDITVFPYYSGAVWDHFTWVATAGTHYVIPLNGDTNILHLKSASNNACFAIPVTSYTSPVNGQPVANMSQYVVRPYTLTTNTEINIVLPKDAKYLIVDRVYYTDCISEFSLKSITYGTDGRIKLDTEGLHNISVGAMNVRDFGTGVSDGCPDDLVSTNLPLWKNLISGWLNHDFLMINEWYKTFDHGGTLDTYNTLFKQFYPYKYGLPVGDSPTQMLLSKHPCTFFNLAKLFTTGFDIPVGICNIGGKSVAVVCWLQSSSESSATRISRYEDAAKALSGFDVVIVAGDYNTEDGLEELETWTEAGYTLGNGGYWGTINTWPANAPATPNDNIVSKGVIYKLFEKNDEHITSDHLPVRAEFSF